MNYQTDVFAQKPAFAQCLEEWGEKTLLTHYTQRFLGLTTPSEQVLSAIESETEVILGCDVAREARASVARLGWTNTTDHHGLLFHPYFYTNALARSHTSVRGENRATVTLPFGGISLSNDSFPRGFYFHDREGKRQRVLFKTNRDRQMPVYGRPPISREDFLRSQERAPMHTLSDISRDRLNGLFEHIWKSEIVWRQETYSAQLTAMNAAMWKHIFQNTRGDFVYVELDAIVRNLLLNVHMKLQTPVHQLIFDPTWRNAFQELFQGVFGSHDGIRGTHLFWYLDEDTAKRQSLFIKNDVLMTREGDVVIPLEGESLTELLATRTVLPSTALSLIMVHCVEGLSCAGGSSQIGYLADIERAWGKLIEQQEQQVPATHATILCTEGTLGNNTSLCSNETPTLIDLYLTYDNLGEVVDQILPTLSLRESVDGIMPLLHKLYVDR